MDWVWTFLPGACFHLLAFDVSIIFSFFPKRVGFYVKQGVSCAMQMYQRSQKVHSNRKQPLFVSLRNKELGALMTVDGQCCRFFYVGRQQRFGNVHDCHAPYVNDCLQNALH